MCDAIRGCIVGVRQTYLEYMAMNLSKRHVHHNSARQMRLSHTEELYLLRRVEVFLRSTLTDTSVKRLSIVSLIASKGLEL